MEQVAGADAIFLAAETPTLHGHVGGLVIIDPSDAPDFGPERVAQLLAERIPRNAPRFAQKLVEVPLGLDLPYWVDDPDFDVAHHVRRIAVPSPGGMRELAELCGYLFEQKLDRRRPLWEMWFIEGVEDGRVAIFAKNHHCMMDGMAGAALGQLMLDLQPDAPPPPPGPRMPYRYDPPPGDLEMLLRGGARLLGRPVSFARYAGRMLQRGLATWSQGASLFESGQHLAFNRAIGPKRAFATSSVPLADVKALARQLRVKLNDVILELCVSAVRRYLAAAGEPLEGPIFLGCPISTRELGDTSLGNQLDAMYVSCPLELSDPLERVRTLHANAASAKELAKALLPVSLPSMGDTAPPLLINLSSRALGAVAGSIPTGCNVTVSNVPGPPAPLYSAGARVDAMYPISLLAFDQGLNITAISYTDRLDFGLTVDPELIADPWFVADGIPRALRKLATAAEKRSAGRRRSAHAAESDGDERSHGEGEGASEKSAPRLSLA